jgi:hypothetical protein
LADYVPASFRKVKKQRKPGRIAFKFGDYNFGGWLVTEQGATDIIFACDNFMRQFFILGQSPDEFQDQRRIRKCCITDANGVSGYAKFSMWFVRTIANLASLKCSYGGKKWRLFRLLRAEKTSAKAAAIKLSGLFYQSYRL